MKIFNISNVDKFFEVVDSCHGQVHVISPEGDDIVLTSKLSRFLFAALNEAEIDNLDLELKCDNPDDTIKFIEYLVRG